MTIYHPLLSAIGKEQIRLCCLLPGTFGENIRCHITSFYLIPTLEFEALSYSWGDLTDQVPIEANSETIFVTKSLATALHYLRQESIATYLWIDAICIDQNDDEERSRQVALMEEIYRSATRVISWLGIRDSFFDPFVEMEHAIFLFQHISFLKKHAPFQKYLESNGDQKPYPAFEDHKKKFDNGLYSLQLLIGEREREKPAYWQRAWIIQEVACARSWTLRSGPYSITEEDIKLVTEFIGSAKVAALLMDVRYEQRKLRSSLQSDAFIPVSIYQSLGHSSQATWICGPLELLTLLRHNRSRLCKDKRDKVYSVLGISNLKGYRHPGVAIEYSKSVSEVYIGAVQAIIDSSSSLEVLCSTNLAATTSLAGELPSWVPDWGVQMSSDTCDRPVSFGHQKATGTIAARYRFWKDSAGKQILTAAGFSVGSILAVQDPLIKLHTDTAQEYDAAARMIQYTSAHHQLSQAFREIAKALHPKPLSRDLFRRTCSLGLLDHDLNDSFKEIMDDLELDTDPARVFQGLIDFPSTRFRYKLMSSSLSFQCMFAWLPGPVSDSTELADGIIGVAPSGAVRQGDVICLIHGCSAPLILRPCGDRFLIVCPAYVDNLMDGSAMAFLQKGLSGVQNFDLE